MAFGFRQYQYNNVEKDMTLVNGTHSGHHITSTWAEILRSASLSLKRLSLKPLRYGLLGASALLCAATAQASVESMSGLAEGVAVSGEHAYVANGFNGLRVIDVSHPRNPTVLSNVITPDYANDVAVSGRYAYVAATGSGLQVIDISKPLAPVIVGSAATPDVAYAVKVVGDLAYVADGNTGLQIIDVSNPKAPVLAARVNTPGHAEGVFVAGNYAYVADGPSGLQVIDVSHPNAPALVGSADTPGFSKDVAVANGHAYVADTDSMQVIDVSNPKAPKIQGWLTSLHDAVGVATKGHYVLVANRIGQGMSNNTAGTIGPDIGNGMVQVIDVSNAAEPVAAGFVEMQGDARRVAVAGDHAYVTQGISGMQVVDIHDPTAPMQVPGYEPYPPCCRHF